MISEEYKTKMREFLSGMEKLTNDRLNSPNDKSMQALVTTRIMQLNNIVGWVVDYDMGEKE